jgi:hypothetical protein
MQVQEPDRVRAINDEQQPEGVDHDGGPSAPRNRCDVARDVVEGDSDAADGD